MMEDDRTARAAAASRVSLAIITEPGQANPFGTLHGGVLLRLADECGAIAALRHAGRGQITTAAIDSMTFLGPVYVGERVELIAEVTHAGRTSIESRIEIFAEPLEQGRAEEGGRRLRSLRRARRPGPAAASGSPALVRDRGRPRPRRGRPGTAGRPPGTAGGGAEPSRRELLSSTLSTRQVNEVQATLDPGSILVRRLIQSWGCWYSIWGRAPTGAGTSNLGTDVSLYIGSFTRLVVVSREPNHSSKSSC